MPEQRINGRFKVKRFLWGAEMSEKSTDGFYVFGPYRLQACARILVRDGVAVAVGSRAFDMLVALVHRPGQVLSRRDLMSLAWPGLTVEESNVRVQMAHLRREIHCGENGERYIVSIAGRGYCFVAPVEWEDSTNRGTGIEGSRELQSRADGASRLPAPHSHPVGRDECLFELSKAIQDKRLVTVVGPGGVGKTTLATMAMHMAGSFERIHFVDLSAVSDIGSLVIAIAAAAGITNRDCTVEQLVTFLSAGRTLLTLDNCEHMIDAAAELVDRILRDTSAVHILATSREAFRLPGEVVHLLKPLAFPPLAAELTGEDALKWPAVRLFVDRAIDGGCSDPMDDEQIGIVAALCRRLEGNPLAIELVASRTGSYGLDRICDLLDNRLALAWRGSRCAPQRHQTVQSMLDWSYIGLCDEDQRVLRRLSIFQDAFSLDAALVVARGDGMEDSDVAASIAVLVDKSLLVLQPGRGASTLKLSEFTKTYAAAKLAETEEYEDVHQRYISYRSGMSDKVFDLKDMALERHRKISVPAA
jgi:predicted ATPase/DNA-binding winged helix-turn-helix (wHTH) protein